MRPLLVLILCSIFPSSVCGAPVSDLQAVIESALHHDPRLAAARARIEHSRAGLLRAGAGKRPEVALLASTGKARYNADGYITPDRSPEALVLTVDQSLYDFGRTAASTGAAAERVDAAQAARQATVVAVILGAAKAALHLDLAHKRLATERENVEVLRQQLAYTRTKRRHGDFTATDVAQARSRYAAAMAQRRAAQATLSRAKARLQRFTGVPMDVRLERLPDIPAPASLAAALKKAESQPALHARRDELDAAYAEVRRAQVEYHPSLDLVTTVGTDRGTRFSNERTDYWSAQVRLSIPLYARGTRRADVAGAQARVDDSAARLTKTRRELTQRVRDAWAAMDADDDELKAAREQRRAAYIALQGVQSELTAGTRTVVDLLNAQQELRNANLAVLGARYRRAIGGLRMLAATGELKLFASGPY